MQKPSDRFTQTVQDYVKINPFYLEDVLRFLVDECQLSKHRTIAGIGTGTGFVSRLLLEYGNVVYGVEANPLMRDTMIEEFRRYPSFSGVDGTAENTSLDNKSIDIIMAGTAFHWFDLEKTKAEFKRVLKPQGWVLLIWNVRNPFKTDFLIDYENYILKHGKDFRKGNENKTDDDLIQDFFRPFEAKVKSFTNIQQFNWEGLVGKLSSTSHCLKPDDANYEEMLRELRDLYEKHQLNGLVDFEYVTNMYYGHLNNDKSSKYLIG